MGTHFIQYNNYCDRFFFKGQDLCNVFFSLFTSKENLDHRQT